MLRFKDVCPDAEFNLFDVVHTYEDLNKYISSFDEIHKSDLMKYVKFLNIFDIETMLSDDNSDRDAILSYFTKKMNEIVGDI